MGSQVSAPQKKNHQQSLSTPLYEAFPVNRPNSNLNLDCLLCNSYLKIETVACKYHNYEFLKDYAYVTEEDIMSKDKKKTNIINQDTIKLVETKDNDNDTTKSKNVNIEPKTNRLPVVQKNQSPNNKLVVSEQPKDFNKSEKVRICTNQHNENHHNNVSQNVDSKPDELNLTQNMNTSQSNYSHKAKVEGYNNQNINTVLPIEKAHIKTTNIYQKYKTAQLSPIRQYGTIFSYSPEKLVNHSNIASEYKENISRIISPENNKFQNRNIKYMSSPRAIATMKNVLEPINPEHQKKIDLSNKQRFQDSVINQEHTITNNSNNQKQLDSLISPQSISKSEYKKEILNHETNLMSISTNFDSSQRNQVIPENNEIEILNCVKEGDEKNFINQKEKKKIFSNETMKSFKNHEGIENMNKFDNHIKNEDAYRTKYDNSKIKNDKFTANSNLYETSKTKKVGIFNTAITSPKKNINNSLQDSNKNKDIPNINQNKKIFYPSHFSTNLFLDTKSPNVALSKSPIMKSLNSPIGFACQKEYDIIQELSLKKKKKIETKENKSKNTERSKISESISLSSSTPALLKYFRPRNQSCAKSKIESSDTYEHSRTLTKKAFSLIPRKKNRS